MAETHLLSTPLMERTVCTTCGHFHRTAIARLCDCCRDDMRSTPHDADPLRPGARVTRCRFCARLLRWKPGGVYRHSEEEVNGGVS
jgi:hypothetical protein